VIYKQAHIKESLLGSRYGSLIRINYLRGVEISRLIKRIIINIQTTIQGIITTTNNPLIINIISLQIAIQINKPQATI
jgi:hypothetical protein